MLNNTHWSTLIIHGQKFCFLSQSIHIEKNFVKESVANLKFTFKDKKSTLFVILIKIKAESKRQKIQNTSKLNKIKWLSWQAKFLTIHILLNVFFLFISFILRYHIYSLG